MEEEEPDGRLAPDWKAKDGGSKGEGEPLYGLQRSPSPMLLACSGG